MKKLLTTAIILFAVMAFSFAQQTVASDFYLMKTQQDAEQVLKAINSELHLAEAEYAKVKELLVTSSKSQEEQLKSFTEAERLNIIKTRQTAHIENNLRGIVGVDKYNIYLNKKADIEAKLKSLKEAKN
jgi:hypothetical protein